MMRVARPQIAVIGELNVDIVASGLRDLPQMGREILARDFELTLGSASAIFASGISKLGHPVTFISQVGTDELGTFCIDTLEKSGVSTGHVSRSPKIKTGVTIALSNIRDRALITYQGAIATFGYQQLKLSLLSDHRHLHMTSYFLQTALRDHFPEIFRRARNMGLTTSFDPNSDPTDSWNPKIHDVLSEIDLLFINEIEAMKLTGVGTIRNALKALQKFVPYVVIKRGARGAIAFRDGKITKEQGFKVKPVDTTGAGDSFAAGFVSAYVRGATTSECLRYGNACGALSTLKLGGTAGQPNNRGLRKFIREQLRKE